MTSTIEVCDVGARYGIHPSWKNLEDFEISFHLIEADPDEAVRLERKFIRDRGHNSFHVHNVFLGSAGSEGVLYHLSNRAMSGSFLRKKSRLFSGERAPQVEVSEVRKLVSHSLDELLGCVPVDFLKVDTEGSELEVLSGAKSMLEKSIIGVRTEVAFNKVFYGAPLFREVDEFLRSLGFDILNFDFTGKGDLQHPFVNPERRFGVLNLTDAIWLHRDFTSVPFLAPTDVTSLVRMLKAVVFMFANHCPDLALAVLSESRQIISRLHGEDAVSSLLVPLSRLVEHHLYSLKWCPGQSISDHASWFRDIFLREMRTGTEFMSSLDLNP